MRYPLRRVRRKFLRPERHAIPSRFLRAPSGREDWLEDFVDSLPQTVFEVDAEGRILYSNRKAFEMFGYPPGTWEEGLRCFDFIAPEDRERARANMADLLRREEEQGRGGTEYAAIRADGSRFPVLIHTVPILRAGKPLRFRGMIVDISASKRIEAELRAAREQLLHSARHDILTGLPNRRLLFERLEQTIRGYPLEGAPFALLFLDLDGFKEVNDRLGHVAGDRVLRIAGQRIRSVLRGSDTVARFGGDEFVILAEGTGTLGALRKTAAKVEEALRAPLSLRTAEATGLLEEGLSVSWGWSLFPEDGTSPDALLRAADARMYAAKRSGRERALS